jgi:hypothetical protein
MMKGSMESTSLSVGDILVLPIFKTKSQYKNIDPGLIKNHFKNESDFDSYKSNLPNKTFKVKAI